MQVLVHVVLYMYTEKCEKCSALCGNLQTLMHKLQTSWYRVPLCMHAIDCNGPEIDAILDHIPHSAKLAIFPCIIHGT